MIIFSHRGLGFNEEENSIEGYRKALMEGFSIEIDVQKTKDNQIVISHDANLKRTKNIDMKISESSLEDIKHLIPSFNEILNILSKSKQEQLMAIHIKDKKQESLLRILCNQITEEKIENRCFVFDVTKAGRDLIRSINPNIKVAFSVGEKVYGDTIYLWEDVCNEDFDIVWWDEWVEGTLYKSENLKLLKECGKVVYAISPELHQIGDCPPARLNRIKNVWDNLIAMNVDGLCTDYPLDLRGTLLKISL